MRATNETPGLASPAAPPGGHFHSPGQPAKAPTRSGISPLKPEGPRQFGTWDPAPCRRIKATGPRANTGVDLAPLFLSTRRFILMGTRRTPGCRLVPSCGLHCSSPHPPGRTAVNFVEGVEGGWGGYLRSLPWPPSLRGGPPRPPPLAAAAGCPAPREHRLTPFPGWGERGRGTPGLPGSRRTPWPARVTSLGPIPKTGTLPGPAWGSREITRALAAGPPSANVGQALAGTGESNREAPRGASASK